MVRRIDTKTAELVEIALLTRAAFKQGRAEQYVRIAGIPQQQSSRYLHVPQATFELPRPGMTCLLATGASLRDDKPAASLSRYGRRARRGAVRPG